MDSASERVRTSLFLTITVLSVIQGLSDEGWQINISHSSVCAVAGSTVVILCSFTHPPNVTVKKVLWTVNHMLDKDFLEYPEYMSRVQHSGDMKNNCTLALREVDLSDSKVYFVRIVAEQEVYPLTTEPIRFMLSVTELSVEVSGSVVEGGEARLRCRRSCGFDDNNPTVTWRKNGQDVLRQTNNSDLVLQNIRIDDEGDYSCALKGREKHPSKAVALRVMYAPKNILASISPTGDVPEGSSVNLTCNSDANPPAENYTWFKSGTVPSHIGSGQTHRIIDLNSDHTGQYYCEGQNSVGLSKSPEVYLEVQYAPKNTSALVSPSGGIVEGTSVTLTCSSDANPSVENYTWFKKIGVTISELVTEQVYTIPKVSYQHTGYYYCEAKNQYGASNSSDVNLDVEYAPRNTSVSVSPSGGIVEGSLVTLTCSSDGNPPVENYTWFNVDKNATSPMATGSIYSISNFNFEYYCQADNKHGVNNSTVIHLEVYYAPKNTLASISPPGDVPKGSSVTLSCSSDANPPVENYTWFKVDESTPVGSGQQYNITDISSEDGGQYYCEGQNSVGLSRSPEVYLEVQLLQWQNIAVIVAMASVPFTVIVLYCLIYRGVKKCSKRTQTQATVDNVYEEVSEVLLTTCIPAPTVDAGDQDDVQYASVQFKNSRGQQVPVYSTVQKFKPHPQQQEEVEYVTVNFSRPTAATQQAPDTVIYSKSTNRNNFNRQAADTVIYSNSTNRNNLNRQAADTVFYNKSATRNMNSKRPRGAPPAPPSPARV
ncbi:B-cell receptor CD22-like isoform X1 [Alosa sapidissima]|uniref:B-cell receptor CD22-like isoform X1 n=1 Tax=Alosa sapidissima TaxID=34773 RepID=UPI001C099544|nr:B-cell receptor CD22-like isoform X1 [Alosa sapidissima]